MLEKEVDGTNCQLGIIQKFGLTSVVNVCNGRNYGVNISFGNIEKAFQILDCLYQNNKITTEICKQGNQKRDVYLLFSEVAKSFEGFPLRTFEEIKKDEKYRKEIDALIPSAEIWVV